MSDDEQYDTSLDDIESMTLADLSVKIDYMYIHSAALSQNVIVVVNRFNVHTSFKLY